MRILADHCVPTPVLNILRAEGFDVVRVVDIADPRASDRDVAQLAARLDAILLTTDTDFERRRDFPPRRHGGIVLLKDLQAAPERVLRRLVRLLAAGARDLDGRLAVLDRRSARMRR